MSANRFDTPRVDAIKEAAAVETFASSKASVGSAELVAESLSIFSKAMTDAQTLQNEAFENVLIGLVTQLNVNQSSITDKLSVADVSMNEKMTTSMVTIASTLSAVDVSMIQQIMKINDNATSNQNTLMHRSN
jgi:hypothetical protein